MDASEVTPVSYRDFSLTPRMHEGAACSWAKWYTLSSDQIASVVKNLPAQPLKPDLDADDFTWSVEAVSVSQFDYKLTTELKLKRPPSLADVYIKLRLLSNREELPADMRVPGDISAKEFEAFVQNEWLANTLLLPIIGVHRQDGKVELVDGLPLLSAASYFMARDVYALVGTPKTATTNK